MQAPFDLLDQQFLEAFQNYTASQTDEPTTATPVSRSGGRGRPNGIVFPGRAPPAANNSTFITGGEQDNVNIGVRAPPSSARVAERGLSWILTTMMSESEALGAIYCCGSGRE